MAWTRAPVRPPELLHYSEDATVTVFTPHVPATNPSSPPLVWAIEPAYAPLYWFPRDCVRVTVWANDDDERRRLHDRFDTSAARLHFARVEDETSIRSTELFEYRFDPTPFEPWEDAEGQWVAMAPVRPVEVRTLPDLVDHQRNNGVDLRFVDDLPAARDAVLDAGLPFSIVRWSRLG